MEKKWDTVIPADLKSSSKWDIAHICPAGHERAETRPDVGEDYFYF